MLRLRKSKIVSAMLAFVVVITAILPLGAFSVSASEVMTEELITPEKIMLPPAYEADKYASSGEAVAATNEKSYGDFYYTVSDNEVTITKYVGTSTSVTIPETIDGYAVTTIGNGAFSQNTTINAVYMPNITTIEAGAFMECVSLAIVDISNVVTIGDDAFYYCISLDLSLPASVVSIGGRALFGCFIASVANDNQYFTLKGNALLSKDQTVLIACPRYLRNPYIVPETVTTIGDYAFMGYPFVNIQMPNVTEIGYEAFYYCTSLESVTMPKVTTVADRAFASCTAMSEISMPSVVNFGQNVFEECTLEYVEMASLETVGNSAFYNCTGIKRVSLPNVKKLEFGAFDSCTSLTTVDIPNATTLGRWAFNNCPSLTTVNMPNVTNIGGLAFGYCISLKSIVAPKLTTIGIRAFSGCALEGIDLTNVTSIGKNAFDSCPTAVIYAPLNSYAHQYAQTNNIPFVELSAEKIKSASYKIEAGKVIFTVVTEAGDYNRLKLTTADNLKGSIVTANSYTVNELGHYVWTIKTNAPAETTNYAFDLRSSETGKYTKEYGYCEVEIVKTFKDISYQISGGKIIFTVTTSAGAYNRMKIADASKPSGSLAVSNSYKVNADGDYVWTIKMNAPMETHDYIFDLRSSETGKYIKERHAYTVEIVHSIKSVECRQTSTSLVFTVVTREGDFNRLRCGLSETLTDNIKNTNSYKVNADGDYVWTIKITKPGESTTYYFDLRDSNTNKFIKDYYVFDYVA